MTKRTHQDADSSSPGCLGADISLVSKKIRRKHKHSISNERHTTTNLRENGRNDETDENSSKERKKLRKLKKAGMKDSPLKASRMASNFPLDIDHSAEERKQLKMTDKARQTSSKRKVEENSSQHANYADITEGYSTLEGSIVPKTTVFQYVEHPDLTALPQADIDTFLSSNFISITNPTPASATLRPLTSFTYLPITDSVHKAPFKDFKAPTPIQAAAWPFLFDGRDVIGIAETGSGKTMAFAVPCIRRILSMPYGQRNKCARAVIITPTRELAIQIYDQILQLCKLSGLRAVCVYGGVPKDEQKKSLKTADIVVATPGRLNDFISEGCARLEKAEYLVLDEADRMLDKGFEEEIRKIISATPCVGLRQTVMFTATWPESVRRLAATFMHDPVKIAIGNNPAGDLRANSRIVQMVEVIEPRNKEYRLLQILQQYQGGSKKDDRILVFALYKKEATRLEGLIRSKGFRVAGIHGDLSQEQRTRSLDAFKKGKTPILVATDVAARGLDIPDVQLVCNCTFPLTVEDYVHRIGRTGRAGKQGLAITLFTEHDKANSGALINVLKAANQIVPENLLRFGTTVKRKEHEAYGAFARDVDMTKTAKKIKFN